MWLRLCPYTICNESLVATLAALTFDMIVYAVWEARSAWPGTGRLHQAEISMNLTMMAAAMLGLDSFNKISASPEAYPFVGG